MIYYHIDFHAENNNFYGINCNMDVGLLWHWHELNYDLFRNDVHAENSIFYGINCKMDLSFLWHWHDLEYDLFRNDLHFKLSVGFVSLYILPLYSPKIIYLIEKSH